jgi:hypothetical protein
MIGFDPATSGKSKDPNAGGFVPGSFLCHVRNSRANPANKKCPLPQDGSIILKTAVETPGIRQFAER